MVCKAAHAGAGRRRHCIPQAQVAAAARRGAGAGQTAPAHHQHAAGPADKVDGAALLAERLRGAGRPQRNAEGSGLGLRVTGGKRAAS